MITWRNGTVSGMRREWTGAVELDVALDGDAGGTGARSGRWPTRR